LVISNKGERMSNDKGSGSNQVSVVAGQRKGEMENSSLAAPLAGPKQAALELLLTGKSIAESARSAGVARSTLYEWLKNDPVFQAAYNAWHEEMRESSRSRLLMLTDKATVAVEKALEAGDAKTGMQLLKAMGMLKDRPPGPTDVEDVKRVAGLEKRKKAAQREREEVRALEDERLSRVGI
jgi:AcrR family transcriptional regulator